MDMRTVFSSSFLCHLGHYIESNTPHGDDRRKAIYRGGALIGGSARDERTAVSRLACSSTLVAAASSRRVRRGPPWCVPCL